MQKQQKIYWERQGSDRLCGVHCLNSLLQGPVFTEFDLAQIGLEIDQKEQQLMFNQEKNNQRKNESQNVGDDGNFSIQVLNQALKNYNNINLDNAYQDLKKNKDLTGETGFQKIILRFICNLDKHWFSIRKINGIWYNLNSINQGPEIISDFYLSAFLQSIQEEGYTIFMASELNKIKKENKQFKLQLNGNTEKDIDNALNNNQQELQIFLIRKEQEKKMTAFQGKGMVIQDSLEDFYHKQSIIDDIEINMAIQISLQTVNFFNIQKFLNEEQNGIILYFRLPEGGVFQRCFDQNSQIEDVYDFVKFKQNPEKAYKFVLMTGYPRKCLKNLYQTLTEAGFEKSENIFITKI